MNAFTVANAAKSSTINPMHIPAMIFGILLVMFNLFCEVLWAIPRGRSPRSADEVRVYSGMLLSYGVLWAIPRR